MKPGAESEWVMGLGCLGGRRWARVGQTANDGAKTLKKQVILW